MTVKRLRHSETEVQVVVPDDKAQRLIGAGTYKAVPEAEQLSQEESDALDRAAAEAKKEREGRTSIGAAIDAAVPDNFAATWSSSS